MKEKKIKIIISVMTAAVAGLVVIQILWMMQMIEMERKKFDINAFDAINSAIRRIEDREALEVVREKSGDEENEEDDSVFVLEKSDKSVRFISKDKIVTSVASDGADNDDAEVLLRVVKPGEDSSSVQVTVSDSGDSEKIFVWNNFIKKKSKIVKDVFLELFDRSRNKPLRERLSRMEVKKILNEELNNVGIDTDFEFVVSTDNEGIVIESRTEDSDLDEHDYAKFKVQLFPHEAEDDSDYLTVTFPERESYVFASVAWLLSLSILLIIIIAYVFYKTVLMLLNQKKITEIKNDLINNLTHEFNTPISTIALACEAIGDPQVSAGEEKVKQFTGMIQTENKRLIKLVDNLLNTASIEKGEYSLKPEDVDIRDLIEEALDELGEIIKAKNVNVVFELPEEPLICKCDKFHVKNAIKNLLDNAAKYSGENPEVTIKAEQAEANFVIRVSDNGPGIPKKDMKRIFDTFYRVSKGNVHDVKGYGVGLSYVKKMIEAHGGSVKVENNDSKGALFTIYIPGAR